ncbi:hypothetical protein KFK09_008947 [Dendrobium nobile]|uniref:Chaperone protein DnaJ n=1 Tax=Dendrobium nobile TaxID=94219 RepID=A0A8T3BPI5_DENNO|nr:hypothetical protein KFK09_008947 [Dendrobium nobile]
MPKRNTVCMRWGGASSQLWAYSRSSNLRMKRRCRVERKERELRSNEMRLQEHGDGNFAHIIPPLLCGELKSLHLESTREKPLKRLMTAVFLGSGGTFSGHLFIQSNYLSLQCRSLFVSSPARPKRSSISSSFLSGEFHLCKNPRSLLLRPGWKCQWRKRSVFVAKAKDFYEALNLSRDATIKEIRSSYRNLARKYHPDMNKNPGAEEKFKEISAAYEVLSDEEKRSFYDHYGEAGLQGDYAGANAVPQEIDPFEVFNAFFGQSNGLFGDEKDPERMNFSSRFKQSLGLDIRYDLSLSLEESISGVQREINIACYETCDSCNGSGAKSNESIKTCLECEGRGRMMKTQRSPFGVVSQVSSCPRCGGSGKIVTDHCKMCHGEGKLQIKRSVKINIPAGVVDGSTILIQGEGSSDKKRGVVGELYLFIHVNEKPGIRREGLNLYSEIGLDYIEAILGTTIKVETVEGSRDLCIPPGTQPGDILKFSNMGVPNVKKPSVRGDHHFIVRVQIPKRISEKERFLVEQLASLRNTLEDSATPRKGVFQYDGSKQQTRNQQPNASRKRRRRPNQSFWGSIRNLFGRNKSGSNFASISTHVAVPTLSSVRAEPTFAFAVGAILVTCIFSVIGRNYRSFGSQLRHGTNRLIKKDE